MSETIAQVNDFLDYFFTYGTFWVYAAVFLACFIENLFPPFPGDTFIVAAGGMVALDRLDFVTAFLIINVSGMISVMILYYLGRHHGRSFFMRKNYKYFSVDDINAMENRLNKWGVLILMFSRFVVGMRAVIAIAAGIGRYPALAMVIFSTLSYFIFTGLLMYIAMELVDNFALVEYYFDTYKLIIYPLVILFIVLYIVRRIKRNRN